MTSKKSSVNAFRFTFLRTIRKTCWLPIFLFVISLVVHISPVLEIAKNGVSIGGYGLEEIDFIFFNTSSDMSWILFCAFMYTVPLGLAFMMFRYVMNKSTVNVYFSLGVSRSTMFLSKFSAGCLMLTVAVSVPLIISAFLNVAVLGSSANMWTAFAYILVNYVLFTLNIFAVACLLFALMGTSFEAILYTVVALASPILLYLFADSVVSGYLVGSNLYDVLWSSPASRLYVINDGYYFVDSSITSVVEPLIMFPFSPNLRGLYYVQNTDYNYNFVSPILWLAVIAAVSVSAWLAYKKRKAEICGFMSANNFVTCSAIFIVSSFASTYLLEGLFSIGSKAVSFLIAVLIFTVAYLFVYAVSYRNFKKLFKTAWRLPVIIGVYFAIIIITVISSFVYKYQMPEIEKINSVTIDTETGDVFLDSSDMNNNNIYNISYVGDDLDFMPANLLADEYEEHTAVAGFTSKADIEKAVEIHKELISCSNKSMNNKNFLASHNERLVPVSITIVYELEDGSRFDRTFYTATNEVLAQLAEFTQTDNYKEQAKAHVSSQNDFMDYEYGSSTYLCDSDVVFASPNLSNVTEMPDSELSFNKLFVDALCKDIDNGTFSLDYRNSSELLGYVIFTDSLANLVAGPYAAGFYINSNGELISDLPDGVSLTITDGMDINSKASFYSMLSDYTKTVPVYANMTNVVSVLESSGYMKLLSNKKTPVEVKLWDYQYCKLDERWVNYKGSTMLFNGMWFSGNYKQSDDYYSDVAVPVMPEGSVTVTDPAEMAEIEADMRLVYLTCYDGSYAQIKYDDGSLVYGYVPK